MHKVLDLFCGAGGLAEGLRSVRDDEGRPRFGSAGGVDLWEAACESFLANHSVRPICDEVSEVSVRRAVTDLRSIDLVVGGPPCQGFSTSGKRALEDPRNLLVLRFLEAVRLVRPKAFVMENVQGFTTFQNGQLLEDVLRFVRSECDYKVRIGVLLASLYGAPQRRRRFIMVGTRDDSYRFPDPAVPHGKSREAGEFLFEGVAEDERDGRLDCDQRPNGFREVTFREATADLPPVEAGRAADKYASAPVHEYQRARRAGTNGDLTEHVAPRHSAKMLGMMKHIPEGRSALDPEILKRIPVEFRPSSGFPNSYARIWWDRPAPTMTRNFTTPSSANCIHPSQDRALTLREGARVQTFNDSYRFEGSFGDKRLLIGNAVPPLLAKAIGQSLLPHLES